MLVLKCRLLHIAVDSVSKAGATEAWMKMSEKKAHKTAKPREKAYLEAYISVHFTNKSKLGEAGEYSKCTIPFACVLSCK